MSIQKIASSSNGFSIEQEENLSNLDKNLSNIARDRLSNLPSDPFSIVGSFLTDQDLSNLSEVSQSTRNEMDEYLPFHCLKSRVQQARKETGREDLYLSTFSGTCRDLEHPEDLIPKLGPGINFEFQRFRQPFEDKSEMREKIDELKSSRPDILIDELISSRLISIPRDKAISPTLVEALIKRPDLGIQDASKWSDKILAILLKKDLPIEVIRDLKDHEIEFIAIRGDIPIEQIKDLGLDQLNLLATRLNLSYRHVKDLAPSEAIFLIKRTDLYRSDVKGLNYLQLMTLEKRSDLYRPDVEGLNYLQLRTLQERHDLLGKHVRGLNPLQLKTLQARRDISSESARILEPLQLKALKKRHDLSVETAKILEPLELRALLMRNDLTVETAQTLNPLQAKVLAKGKLYDTSIEDIKKLSPIKLKVLVEDSQYFTLEDIENIDPLNPETFLPYQIQREDLVWHPVDLEDLENI